MFSLRVPGATTAVSGYVTIRAHTYYRCRFEHRVSFFRVVEARRTAASSEHGFPPKGTYLPATPLPTLLSLGADSDHNLRWAHPSDPSQNGNPHSGGLLGPTDRQRHYPVRTRGTNTAYSSAHVLHRHSRRCVRRINQSAAGKAHHS